MAAAELDQLLATRRQRLTEALDQRDRQRLQDWLSEARNAELLDRLLLASDVPLAFVPRDPGALTGLLEPDALAAPAARGELEARVAGSLADVDDADALCAVLRQRRNREMLRIIWRDVTGLASLEDTVREVTQLAEVCLDAAIDWHYVRACAEYGQPRGEATGAPQRLVVLGLGKLGAGELNLSSDIDLIMAYPQAGHCDGDSTRLTNQEFFLRLVQRVVQALDDVTVDGFVFRVDLRLRPYGDAGAIVLPFAAMDTYYETQGRDWERYAFIKARAVAGDRDAGRRWLATLRPFVYRRYLDYGAIDALREMKASINRERRGARMREDIKNGPGGIREIEFVAQVMQLTHGGADARLRDPRLMPVLRKIGDLELLDAQVVAELIDAYRFLRNLEHRLQALRDEQTQQLPRDAEQRLRVAISLGFDHWPALVAELDAHRERVARHFEHIVADPRGNDADGDFWAEVWADPEGGWAAHLAEHNVDDVPRFLALLGELRQARAEDVRQDVGRARLDRLMPLLLRVVAANDRPALALQRTMTVIEAVLRRTAYLMLLVENPAALEQLVRLASRSAWIAAELARLPVLLDELIDVEALYAVPPREQLESELTALLSGVDTDDVEGQMNALRQFKEGHALRVAACEVTGVLELPRISDYLTRVAEVILGQVLALAWEQVRSRHGVPAGHPADVGPGLLVVGYGKLGGIELGPASDLDLVLYHGAQPQGHTDGERPLPNLAFFNRVAQRMVTLLTAQTTSGRLYEIDMRLRPDGSAGPLVSSLDRLRKYLTDSAWTFEHQALVRARPVAGSPLLAERFLALRREVLSRPRDRERLRADVLAMRERIRNQKGSRDEDAKLASGGIVDIEFMVQYLVLGASSEHPELLQFSDNTRILETAARVGLLTEAQARSLIEAYYALRGEAHRQVLHGDAPAADLAPVRERVLELERQVFDI